MEIWLTTCVADLGLKNLNRSNQYCVARDPTINHTVSRDYPVRPTASGEQRLLSPEEKRRLELSGSGLSEE